jgi:DNA-binding CsgD family transcriptional regulator
MTDLNHLVKNYTIRQDRKIKQLCTPLQKLIDLPVFVYHRIDAEGNLIALSNYPEQFEYYYAEKLYLSNPYLVNPQLLRSGCVAMRATKSDEFQESLNKVKMKFQLENPFLIVENHGKEMEGFFFATLNAKVDITPHYLSHLDALKSFGRYFVRESSHIIKKMAIEGYNLKDFKGELFDTHDLELALSSQSSKMKKFFKEISPLTQQERLCLEMFRQGNSAQSTAAKLNISRRTVEHYIDNVKIKLNCNSKWDLLDPYL